MPPATIAELSLRLENLEHEVELMRGVTGSPGVASLQGLYTQLAELRSALRTLQVIGVSVAVPLFIGEMTTIGAVILAFAKR